MMQRYMIISTSLMALLAGCATNRRDLVYVESGSFEMGDRRGEGDVDERPVHRVRVDSFWIGKHEVTVGQFREFVDNTGYVTTAEKNNGAQVLVENRVEQRDDANWRNPCFTQEEDHPVVCVSWYDAIAYCNWRSTREGLEPCYRADEAGVICDFTASGYRLPTEAEWEFAARSRGTEHKYAWGNGSPGEGGRKGGNTRDEAAKRVWNCKNIWEGYDDGYACTAPVCAYKPNALGLHDLSGSVYEWCWDWYDEHYYEHSPEHNPRGPGKGETRACRDCGFICPLYQEILVTRGKAKPDFTFSWGGFRIARTVE